ncbi:hypothetical protein OE88DRAFT_800072 [Heliocybe sulcata]|uniref:Uncharacterized protein n=1 Tax=Heliocybe sulcata TaxID=5364 RepID=A0A5C3MSJ0_9AGAM|nr:hypothetical protein OE88DRAFT_800072 [Heliocybe sulcata]
MARTQRRQRLPLTPVKRLLDYLKPKPLVNLGRRPRPLSFSSPGSTPKASKRTFQRPAQPACPFHPIPTVTSYVAVQNDSPTSGSIIITTFPTPPFCCHPHLQSMDRDQLLAVARTFNSRLPLSMAIPVRVGRTAGDIRRDIELLVGLRTRPDNNGAQDVPGAPKAIRSRSIAMGSGPGSPADSFSAGQPTSPRSPLAQRSHTCSLLPSLEVLAEEEEEEDEDAGFEQVTRTVRIRQDRVDTPTRQPRWRKASPESVTYRRAAGRPRSKTMPDTKRDLIGSTSDAGDRAFTYDSSLVACTPRYRPHQRGEQALEAGPSKLKRARANTAASRISFGALPSPLASGDMLACSTPRGKRRRTAKSGTASPDKDESSFDLYGASALEERGSDEEQFDSHGEL